MSGRQDKKRRQDLRKMYRDDLREMAEINGRLLKPKPRWIPMAVWLWMLGKFVFLKR